MRSRLLSSLSSAYLYAGPIAVQANVGGAFRTFVSSASNRSCVGGSTAALPCSNDGNACAAVLRLILRLVLLMTPLFGGFAGLSLAWKACYGKNV
jgi:hypothetical protein